MKIWKGFMENLRSKHPSLNFFTTDQLVGLSRDLASFIHQGKKQLNKASMMMLKLIANLSDKELSTFVRNHFGTAHQLAEDQMSVDDEDTTQDISEIEDDFETDKFQPYRDSPIFKELRKAQFTETIILAAILSNLDAWNNENSKLSEILMEFCLEHDDEGDCKEILMNFKPEKPKIDKLESNDIEMMEEPLANEIVHDPVTQNEEHLQSIIDVFTFEDAKTHSMVRKLEHIWTNFLNFVNQLNIEDFVNFKVIAKILQELSEEHELKPNRKMLETLNQGKPNLIICPEKEISSACLSLYANDEDKPLPRLDEVLICTPETSLEQIELICRRAFHDKSGKIYCILHAENIDYDASVYIEKIMADSTVTNHKYKLVFITGKESNERSYITTALDHYKRPLPEFMTEEKLRLYLLKQLQIVHQNHDPEGSRSRLVLSEEAGNGKSLVIKNLTAALPNKVITQIHTSAIKYENVINRLFRLSRDITGATSYHFDFASQATKGKEDLIFGLTILGGLSNPRNGNLWLCNPEDFYLMELTLPRQNSNVNQKDTTEKKPILLLNILPKILSLSPQKSLQILQNDPHAAGLLKVKDGQYKMGLDPKIFESAQYQRPYKSLFKVS